MLKEEFKKLTEMFKDKSCQVVILSFSVIGILIGILIGQDIVPKEKCLEENVPQKKLEIIKEEESVEVNIDEISQLSCVDVSGAVKSPGVYCLSEGSLMTHYLDQADGVNSLAYSKKYFEQRINGALVLKNGAKIYIPYKDDVECEFNEATDAIFEGDFVGGKELAEDVLGIKDEVIVENSDDQQEDKVDEDSTKCVDINVATLTELDELEGIGPSTAQKIIDARPYSGIEDLLDVSGIGETKFDSIKDFVCVL